MTDFLTQVTIFRGLSDKELKTISQNIEKLIVKKGEMLFASKDIGSSLFIVHSGRLVLNLSGKTYAEFKKFDSFGEVALINNRLRTGSVTALEDSELFVISGEMLIAGDLLGSESRLKVLREISRKVAGYLSSDKHIETSELIRSGENDNIEFKSTLRYNLHNGKNGKEIEHASLKTIAAFLNTSGGTLLIGVTDDKNIAGIEKDNFENDDRALLHLTNLVKDKISNNHVPYVNAEVENIEGKKVIRIDVEPATTPAYLEYNGKEQFYIRTGPSTTDLKVSEVYDFIINRFYRPSQQ